MQDSNKISIVSLNPMFPGVIFIISEIVPTKKKIKISEIEFCKSSILKYK